MTHGAEDYDALHRAVDRSPLLVELYAEAYGDQYPAEVSPTSSCTWWLLGEFVTALRSAAGGLLVDLGCGRGGPGLWLARALPARLVGIDLSPLGVRLATARVEAFGMSGRAEFRVGTFAETGLADRSADAALSLDAVPFAPDRAAAVREAYRLLRPGGRFAFTAGRHEDWPGLLSDAGFELVDDVPDEGSIERWLALFTLVEQHADALREQLDPLAATNLFDEARRALGSGLAGVSPRLLVARRPE